MSDSDSTGQRRQREITPGDLDPQKSAYIDMLLAKYRGDQEPEKPAAENSSRLRRGLRLSPLAARQRIPDPHV